MTSSQSSSRQSSSKVLWSSDTKLDNQKEANPPQKTTLDIKEVAEEEEDEESEEKEEIIEIMPLRLSHETLIFKGEEYRFPVLYDPGLNEAFSYRSDPPKIYAPDGQELYYDIMKQEKCPVSSGFYNGLITSVIDLQFGRINPSSVYAMSKALIRNTSVKVLNLRGNKLSTDAAFHIGQMLSENKTINVLNLSGCGLGPDGVNKLGDALELSTSIYELDLSYNDLGDAGIESLINGVGYNASITYLNLSHNRLTHLSGWHFADIFVENSTIVRLDISWNEMMQEPGLKKMLFSIGKLNEALEHLDMSWNNLSGENIASFFKGLMTKHKFIKHIDLRNNRFRGEPVVEAFSKGINSCESLVTFDLSFNPLLGEDIKYLITNLSTTSSIKQLKLSNMWVPRDVSELAKELHQQGGPFVELEGSFGIGKDAVSENTIREMFLKRAHYLGLKPKKKSRQVEFGWFLLRLLEEGKLKPIKKYAFEELVEKEGLLLDVGLGTELAKVFRDDKKKVDLPLMLDMYMRLFPDTALPKKKGKKAGPEEVVINPQELVDGLLCRLIEEVVVEKKKEESKPEKATEEESKSVKDEPKSESPETGATEGVENSQLAESEVAATTEAKIETETPATE